MQNNASIKADSSLSSPETEIFSHRTFVVLMIVFAVFRLLLNALLPLFDPSEARYAAIGKNMAVLNNFLEPQLVYNGILQIFEGKPPLFFQCSGLSCNLFGVNEFAVRLPAFISAIAILISTYFTTKILKGAAFARLATLLCAATPVFFLFAGLCMTDLMLAATVTGAIQGYMLFTSNLSKKTQKTGSLLIFGWLGVGMIVKGPVAIVMAGLPIFFYVLINKDWKRLKNHCWLYGILLFLLISSPWYIMMARKHPDFLEYFFINENLKRFLIKEYGDRYGNGQDSFRGMALLFYLVCNLPFVLAFCTMLKRSVRRAYFAKGFFLQPLAGLALFTILSNTLFWCLTSRVLLTYLLPTIPATAILLADFLTSRKKDFSVAIHTKCPRIIIPIFLGISIVGLLLMSVAGSHITPQMSRSICKAARLFPEYAQCKCYFARRTPYSAEFYLGKRVQNHDAEERTQSLRNSSNALLFLSAKDFKRMEVTPQDIHRKLLCRKGLWYLYAPVTVPVATPATSPSPSQAPASTQAK